MQTSQKLSRKSFCKNGWSWNLEMLILANKADYKIKEVPIRWRKEGTSTFGRFYRSNKTTSNSNKVDI